MDGGAIVASQRRSWISALARTPLSSWREAAHELLVIAVLSIIPLAAKLVVRMYHGLAGKKLDFWHALTSILKEGELLLLALALVGSVVWMSSRDFTKSTFSGRVWFTIFSILTFAVSVFFIGFNPDFQTLPPDLVTKTSIIFFLLSNGMYLLMTVLQKFETTDYGKALGEGERQLTAQLEDRKT
jgi:hypothetical protein